MQKFVLIDHSITGIGGNHYEYAVHVLRAAARAGYHPVLVTNRKFHAEEALPWEIYRAYTFGLWMHLATPKWLQAINESIAQFKKQRDLRIVSMLTSRLAALCGAAKYRHAYIRGLFRSKRADIILATILIGIPLLPLLLLLALIRVAANAKRCLSLCRSRHDKREESSVTVNLRATRAPRPRASLFSRVKHLLTQGLMRRAYNNIRTRAFARDSMSLFQQLPLDEGDVVFIPTLVEAELRGLTHFFQQHPRAAQARWHLLFRRNLYNGREHEYAGQMHTTSGLQRNLACLCATPAGPSVSFWTDTDELTNQYNRLGAVPFRTLAVPHTDAPRAEEPEMPSPINITYLGDAREEKGYQYLPQLIEDLREEYVDTGRVMFTLQSNYNCPGGEAAAFIARAQLALLPAAQVRLITNPLTNVEYRELLATADVLLLPYEPTNYYARSSGVLVEALTLGIPVIVPAGCWLSQQLAEVTGAYHARLRAESQVLESKRGAEISWSGSLCESSGITAAWSLAAPAQLLCVRLANPACIAEGAFVQIRVTQDGPHRLPLQRTALIGRSPSGVLPSALFALEPGATQAAISISMAYGSPALNADDFVVERYRLASAKHGACPTGAVGVIYHTADELSAALREVLAHYAHYRGTARQFMHGYYARHNADQLLQTLCPAPAAVDRHLHEALTHV